MFEIADDPSTLFNEDFDPDDFSVEGIKLHSDYSDINYYDIISIEVPDDNYYSNDNFSRRLEKLKDHPGYIKIVGETYFRIENQKVKGIILGKRYFKRYEDLTEEDLILILGKPDKILLKEIFKDMESEANDRILHYEKKQLNFYIGLNKKVKQIKIGGVVADESYYKILIPE